MSTGTDDPGEPLKRRRLMLGIKSRSELSRLSGLSREAITAAEHGTASPATYERLEAWLDRFEHSTSSDANDAAEAAGAGLIEFEVSGDFGVRVVVRGPITNAEDLERSVARIVQNIRNTQKDGVGSPPERS